MTFYLQTYPFGSAQDRPYRRMARRWVENRDQTLGINVREEQDAYVLSALVPGIKSEELNIQVLDDVVRIHAEYKADENDGYLVQELPSGSFTRTLRLPAPIEAAHVEADITNGVLTLTLPKAESARPKQIKIRTR
ncbi:MAG: Hsp20/alpha crystallin family protein [Anaerolineales bacterium]|nr:Hsp20/alpha crystallin family protein [Anaerolineales bacterium]